MAITKQSMTWQNFYGGMSNDDKFTQSGQVVYSSGIDLKRNSEYIQLNPVPTKTLTTNGKLIYNFLNVSNTQGAKRTFGLGQDGVIYWVGGTNNVPNYTATSGGDIVNSIEFNNSTYIMTTWAGSIGGVPIKYDKILSDDMYNLTGVLSQTILDAGLYGTRGDKYPMYNYLESFLYIGVGKTIFREDNLGVKTLFELGTSEIVAITELGGVFRLYQDDGRILLWDGISDAVDTVININDTIRNVISHKGIDYIIGGPSDFYSNLYYMNGYQAVLLQSGITSDLSPANRQSKFYFKDNIISYNNQLILVNNSVEESVCSYGHAKVGFPQGFEDKFHLTPNGIIGNYYGLGNSTSATSFYYGYNDATDTGIGHYQENVNAYTREGSLILPKFNAGTSNLKKKIEAIKVYSTQTQTFVELDILVNIDGGGFSTVGTVNKSGRVIFYNKIDEFYELSFKINFSNTFPGDITESKNPRLHEIQLVYTVIEE